jgi:APA family basic amino acid/polyamine antiporter
MAGLLVITWLRFFGWLAIGMVIYWLYSRRHSEFAPDRVSAGKG